MQHRLLSLLATVGIAVAVLVAVPVSAQAAPQAVRSAKAPASMNGLEDRLLTEINQARSANGLEAIRSVDACTDRLAEQWGQRIARTGLFEHRDQNEVIEKCDNSWAGETLVRGSGLTPAAMVQLWLDSPGHRAILLSPRARRAGIAITRDPQGRMIGVVNMVRHR